MLLDSRASLTKARLLAGTATLALAVAGALPFLPAHAQEATSRAEAETERTDKSEAAGRQEPATAGPEVRAEEKAEPQAEIGRAGARVSPIETGTVKKAVAEPPPIGPPQEAAAKREADPPPLDPLTPPKVDLAPAQAPAAVRSNASSAPAIAAPALPATQGASDTIVAEARRLLSAPQRGAAPEDRAALAAFYEAAGQPVWTSREGLSTRGAAAIAELGRAADWGLEAAAFDTGAAPAPGAVAEELAAAEVRIGLAVLRYARHARGGRIPDPSALSKMIDMKPRLYEARSVLDAIAASDDPAAYLTGLHPRHEGFRRLQKALVELRQGSQAAAAALQPAAAAEEAGEDGKRGRKARAQKATGEKPARQYSRSDKESRIVVNMERWRWLPDDLGQVYVLNNIPEQLTRVYNGERVTFQEKIVVGKPATPTPQFSADMRFVIFHPTWGVPEGIKSNELGPALRRASGGGSWFFGGGDGASRVLERHNLRVYSGGREINPNSVDWSSVDPRRFTFVQPPGGRNVLGVVKFRFPNRHDVYMHDTQDKHLFAHAVRAYSHGCMRVQNPMRFAEVLLNQDKGWTSDRVQSHLGRSGPIDVTLDRPIAVHNVYLTARVDDTGTLRLHGDLYGMDARVASALAGRTVHLAAAEAAAPEAAAPRRERRAQQSSSAGSGATPAVSQPAFNPFSGLSGN